MLLFTVAPVLLIGPLLIVSRAKAITILLLRNPALLLLLLWVWCSVLWSVAPDLSARRALILTVYSLLACCLVVRHHLDWICKKLVWLLLALLIASVFFILFVPSVSFARYEDYGDAGLRGIFSHKQGMGHFLDIVVILLLPGIRKRLVHPVLGSAGLIIALVLLVPVRSASAIVVMLVILATHAAIILWRLHPRLAATVTAVGVAVACPLIVAAFLNLDAIFELLGRGPTLTGRIEIWRFTWGLIQQRPLVGYGYDASLGVDEFAYYVAAIFSWFFDHPHSGYLQLLLTLGVVGLALFMLFLGSGLVRMMIASNRLDSGLIGILPALVVASMTHAITESDVLDRNINWVLIVIFTVSTTPDLAAIKSRLVARCQPPRSPTMATRLTPNTVALLKPPSNGQQDTG